MTVVSHTSLPWSEPVSEWCREEMAEAARAVQVAHLWCRWVILHQCGHFLMHYPFSAATIRSSTGCTGVLVSLPHTQEISLLILEFNGCYISLTSLNFPIFLLCLSRQLFHL